MVFGVQCGRLTVNDPENIANQQIRLNHALINLVLVWIGVHALARKLINSVYAIAHIFDFAHHHFAGSGQPVLLRLIWNRRTGGFFQEYLS